LELRERAADDFVDDGRIRDHFLDGPEQRALELAHGDLEVVGADRAALAAMGAAADERTVRKSIAGGLLTAIGWALASCACGEPTTIASCASSAWAVDALAPRQAWSSSSSRELTSVSACGAGLTAANTWGRV
jgi:hypothetical protein